MRKFTILQYFVALKYWFASQNNVKDHNDIIS